MSNHQVSTSIPARIILIIDAITFFLAIAILGLSIWGLAEFSSFALFVNMTTLGIGIGVGIGLIITSCFGICGSTRGNKFILFCYFFLITGLFTAQVVASVYVVNYNNIVATQNQYVSGAMATDAQIHLNNAILSVYTTCCTGCPPGVGCSVVTPTTAVLLPYCNTSLPVDNNNTPFVGRTCAFAQQCTSPTDDGCYVTPLDGSPLTVPAAPVDATICTALIGVTYNNTNLVGNAYPQGACGGGLPSLFLHEMNGYLAYIFYNLMIVWIFFATLQGVNALSTAYIEFCWNPHVKTAPPPPPQKPTEAIQAAPKHIVSQDLAHA